jgi:hypothetical protein
MTGVRLPVRVDISFLVQTGPEAHPASYPEGTGSSFPALKRPGREADHTPQSTAEAKNEWSYTFTPKYAFMASCLVKHRDKFTFYLYRGCIASNLTRRWYRGKWDGMNLTEMWCETSLGNTGSQRRQLRDLEGKLRYGKISGNIQ